MLTGAAALAMSFAIVSPANADENKGSGAQLLKGEVPAASELKIKDGTAEGHKSPLEVVKKAVKAAKAGELAALKSCIAGDAQDYLDEKSWDSDKEETNLQMIAKIIGGWSEENLAQLEQGKIGNYAIVAVKNGDMAHIVKTSRIAPEDKEEAEGGKKVHNWYLTSGSPYEYRIDYNAAGVKAIREAIQKSDGVKLKENLQEWQTNTLELLKGVQEGVDPYDLLAKRLNKIISNGGETAKPRLLLNRYGSSVAYWFSSEKADTFLVLQFWEDYDWETSKKFTKVTIDIDSTSNFHKDAAGTFTNWVSDYEW